MKTATVSDLTENFAQVSAWIENGEPVEIVKAGKVFARLVPADGPRIGLRPKVDFHDRIQRLWGSRIFSDAEVQKMRDMEMEGGRWTYFTWRPRLSFDAPTP